MDGNSWKGLIMAENGWKWLEMDDYGLKHPGNSQNSWICLKIAENGLTWLEMALNSWEGLDK